MIPNRIIQDYFKNINYDIDCVNYATCYPNSWGDKDFVPYQNKIYLITDGRVHFKIAKEEFIATKGDMLLLPMHISQSYEILSSSFSHYYTHFRMPSLNNNIDLFDVIRCPYIIPLNEEQYEHSVSMFNHIINHNFAESLTQRFLHLEYYNKLILSYISLTEDRIKYIKQYQNIDYITKISDLINNNINKHISIEEMASKLHLHPNYFIRLFKKHFGLTPTKYINTIKIKKACELILLNDSSISNIATSLGFTDIYYFSRLFKQYTSLSPTEYRNQYLNSNK